MTTNVLRELAARKAKFGFAAVPVCLGNIIQLGKLLEELKAYWPDQEYTVEMVGMQQRDFRLYTDNELLANWVRNNWI